MAGETPIFGIAGKVFRDKERQPEAVLIARMQGRDAAGPFDPIPGILARAPVAFGCRGAEDTQSAGQPAANEDGSALIVFHGKIFNAGELVKELTALGHTIKTSSEAEAVLHGFEQWGKEVAAKLHGMFVFAVYDAKQHTVHICRDRIGKKPLFYAHIGKGRPDEALLFASEVKSMLADPDFERKIDPIALNHYLTYQYVPHPWSIFAQARKLLPGHWLTWRAGSEVETMRYWELQYEPKRAIGEKEAEEEAFAQIDESVRLRVISEQSTPGCALSGGVDSSTIVAMMRRHATGTLKTFSIGFREQTFNELPYARQVADQFQTEHHEFLVEPDALKCLGELAWHFDEPMADNSGIPTWYLSKLAREQVDTLFLGDGGDESFAGYARYAGIPAFKRYMKIPRPLRALADCPFALAAELVPGSAFLEMLSYGNHASLAGREKIYTQTMVMFRERDKRRLLAPGYRGLAAAPEGDSEKLTIDLMNKYPDRAWIDRMTYSDISLYLPGALIPKIERLFTAHRLEGRAPLLDQRVMEFAAKLPADIRFHGGKLKYLLKKLARRFFSGEFLDRPKTGFGVPVGDWVRGPLRPLAEELLLGQAARARGYFDAPYLRRLLDEHTQGRRRHDHRIWVLMIFEAWCRTFVDRQDPLAGPVSIGS